MVLLAFLEERGALEFDGLSRQSGEFLISEQFPKTTESKT
jgi:hypothetical protein